jgi:hypothetical protein
MSIGTGVDVLELRREAGGCRDYVMRDAPRLNQSQ